MKSSLFLTAAFALATSAAFAQTTTGTTGTTTTTSGQTGTMSNGTMGSGTSTSGTMNSSTDRMGDMNGTDKSTMRSNKRMTKKGSKSKTSSDGSMKNNM